MPIINWNDANLDDPQDNSGFAHDADGSNPSVDYLRRGYSLQTGLGGDLLNNGLLAWLPLHSATPVDLSGNGNDGTNNGAAIHAAGRGGLSCYYFYNLDNDWVDFPVSHSGNITVSTWFSSNNSSPTRYVVDCENGAASIRVDSGNVEFRVFDGSTTVTPSHSIGTDSQWYHAVGTTDGTTARLYVNGIERATASVGNPTISGNCGIGARNNGGSPSEHFNGNVADVRVYNRTLSANEVETLYDWGSADIVRPPDNNNGGVSYYELDGDGLDSWGTNDGTETNTLTEFDSVRGQAIRFNGDGSIQDTDFSDDIYAEGTMSIWLKPDITSGYVFWYGTQVDGEARAISVSSTQFTFVAWGTGGSVTSNVTPQTDTWQHVAISWNSSGDGKLYVNGALDNKGSLSLNSNTSQNMTIGDRADLTQPFDGIVDEARLYNRELTASEISEIYRYGTFGRDMRKLTTESKL